MLYVTINKSQRPFRCHTTILSVLSILSKKTESNCSGNLISSCWPRGDHYGNVQYIRIEVFIPAKVTSNSIKNLHSGFW